MRFSLKLLFLLIAIVAALLFVIFRLYPKQPMAAIMVVVYGSYLGLALRAAVGSPATLGSKRSQKVAFYTLVILGAGLGAWSAGWLSLYALMGGLVPDDFAYVLLALWILSGVATGVSLSAIVALYLGYDLGRRWIYPFGIAAGWLVGLVWLVAHTKLFPLVPRSVPTWVCFSLNVWGTLAAVLWARGITGFAAWSRGLAGIVTLPALALLALTSVSPMVSSLFLLWLVLLILAPIVAALGGATHQRGPRFKFVQWGYTALGIVAIALAAIVANGPTTSELRLLCQAKGSDPQLAISSAGETLLVGTTLDNHDGQIPTGMLNAWLLPSLERVLEQPLEYPAHSLAFAPDESAVAVGIGWRWKPERKYDQETLEELKKLDRSQWDNLERWQVASQGRVEFWSLKTNSRREMLDVKARVSALQYSPDGASLATAFIRGGNKPNLHIALWEANTHKIRTSIPYGEGSNQEIYDAEDCTLMFSANSKLVGVHRKASRNADELSHWSSETGEYKQHYFFRSGDNPAVALSPDGKIFARTQRRGTVLVDFQSGQSLYELPKLPDRTTTAVAFSRDGKFLAVGGAHANGHPTFGTIALWSMSETKFIAHAINRRGHSELTSLLFSPDGKRIYAAFMHGSIFEWELPAK